MFRQSEGDGTRPEERGGGFAPPPSRRDRAPRHLPRMEAGEEMIYPPPRLFAGEGDREAVEGAQGRATAAR